jgi:hypothetical protein
MYSIGKNSDTTGYGIKKFFVDTEVEISNIPLETVFPGSTAFVIENSKSYMLNNQYKWIELQSTGGGSSGGGGDIPPGEEVNYDGGTVIG